MCFCFSCLGVLASVPTGTLPVVLSCVPSVAVLRGWKFLDKFCDSDLFCNLCVTESLNFVVRLLGTEMVENRHQRHEEREQSFQLYV